MKRLTLAAVACVMAVVSACASYPERRVTQGGSEAALAFEDAPAGAAVYLNNIYVGTTDAFDGVNGVLDVPPGRHRVRVELGGNVLVDREVFVGRNSTLTVDVS